MRFIMENYQHIELQSLLDLLAEETEKYTKAFLSGNFQETAIYRIRINALIAEINQRKDPLLNNAQSLPDTSADIASPTV